MILFLLFIIIPLIEIALFIFSGGVIGLAPTLLLCVLTAMIGAALIRRQGLQTLFSARSSMTQGTLPIYEIFDGVCLAISGALLMTPGFFTDTIGFSLLIPQFRALLREKLAAHFELNMSTQGENVKYQKDVNIIEAEYETLEDEE